MSTQRINDNLATIGIPVDFGGGPMELTLSLIIDGDKVAIVDAAMPDNEDLIVAELKKLGFEPKDVTKILVTHYHIDHVGSLAALKELTGAEVYASTGEAPLISGDEPLPDSPGMRRMKADPVMSKVLENLKRIKIDHPLEFGSVIDFAGGIHLIGTPGHTAAHTSYYLPASKSLIAGDALVAGDGQLAGPMAAATPDMETAMKSVRGLLDLDIETIVTYHGAVVSEDAPGQLRRVAAQE